MKNKKLANLKNLFKIRAFSLIELSVVIMILSVVTAGFLSTSVSSQNNAKLRSSNDNIPIIYKALGKYLLSNKKLPCPASLKEIRTSSTTYGTAATATDCVAAGVYKSTSQVNIVYGMVPIKDLQLDSKIAEDAYGNKLIYVVDKRLTRTDQSLNSFEDNVSNTTIIQINANGSAVTTAALFAIISRGNNGLGSFNSNSASMGTASTISEELGNDLTSINDGASPPTSTFDNIFSASSTNGSFDDIVFYKTRDQLFDELNLWSLIPCAAGAAETLYCGTSFTWPKAYYGQVVSADQTCPSDWNSPQKRPTKKCGKKGVWESVVDPCTTSDAGAAVCWVGYCTKTSTYGSGSIDASYSAGIVAPGTVITLSCRSGYSKAIDGGTSGSYANECGVNSYSYDRTNVAPTVTCSNGSWSGVSNDCTACRGCTGYSGYDQNPEISQSMSCNSYYTDLATIINECKNIGLSVNNGSTINIGHTHSRKCKAGGNNVCSERNVCAAATVKCLDGKFYYQGSASHSLGGDDSCDRGNGYYNCGSSSQSCGG